MNNLTKLPDSLGCLATLKHLEVSDNRLQTLPVALGEFRFF
jgi:Leucine-rich repeat (LRR) protein